MHILLVTVVGLGALGVFILAGRFFQGPAGLASGALYFIWFWLAVSAINGMIGVVRAGIPVINEIGAFIPIFGIPAAAAWHLSRTT